MTRFPRFVQASVAAILLFQTASVLTGADTATSGDTTAKPPAKQFNVKDYGAKGDGSEMETAAIQKALDACAAAGGGEVVLPAGQHYTGSITLGANTTLRLEKDAYLMGSDNADDYPLVQVRFEGEMVSGHRALVSASNVDHVAIVGSGSLVGSNVLGNLRNPRGPVMIEFSDCKDVRLEDITSRYRRLWSVHILNCTDFVARGVFIRATQTNGDGFDIDSSKNVLIEKCDVDAGDDAISLKSGRGLDAQQNNRPTENVVIKDSTLVSSTFAAIGLGTEMSGGVRNVRIENCILQGVQNAIFIKSRDGRGGFIENVVGENLTIRSSPTFIGIDLVTKGIQAKDPVPGDVEKWARVANIKFNNIKVENVTDLIVGRSISADRPIQGLTLSNITGTCRRGIILSNVLDAKFSNLNVTGYTGPLMTLNNVTGSGLENPPAAPAAPAAAAITPAATSPALATN